MSSLLLTVRESIRYRGRSGHYRWLAHRLSGLAILFFLTIHVWETANAHFFPGLYQWFLLAFKHPLFLLSEIPLIAAVLYHAFNGIRISILDFKPELWKYQARSATIVWVLFAVIFIPIAFLMLRELFVHCGAVDNCWAVPSLNDFRPFNQIHPVP